MAEETSWNYTPDEEAEEPDSSASSPDAVTWTASEYIDHEQGPRWYAGLFGGAVVLAALMYLLTKDMFRAGVVIVVAIIAGVAAARKPQQIPYEISSRCIKIDKKTYGFRVFKSFSIINDGGMNSISLLPLKRFMPRLSLFYDPADEEKIVDILSDRLPYEEHKIDQIERLSRYLRF